MVEHRERQPEPSFRITVRNPDKLAHAMYRLAQQAQPDPVGCEPNLAQTPVQEVNHEIYERQLAYAVLSGAVFSQLYSDIEVTEPVNDTSLLYIGSSLFFTPAAREAEAPSYYSMPRIKRLQADLQSHGVSAHVQNDHGKVALLLPTSCSTEPVVAELGYTSRRDALVYQQRQFEKLLQENSTEAYERLMTAMQKRQRKFEVSLINIAYVEHVDLRDYTTVSERITETARLTGHVLDALFTEAREPLPDEPIVWR